MKSAHTQVTTGTIFRLASGQASRRLLWVFGLWKTLWETEGFELFSGSGPICWISIQRTITDSAIIFLDTSPVSDFRSGTGLEGAQINFNKPIEA